MLRIINNCRKAEMSLGLSMTAKELEETTSGDTPNLRASKLIAEWTATIKAYMLELAERKEQNKDAKEIQDVQIIRQNQKNYLIFCFANSNKSGIFVM